MVEKKSLFILSGVISLSIFILLLSFLLYAVYSSSEIKTYALTKDNFVSISLETSVTPTKKTKTMPTPVEEKQNVTESKKIDIGELFSEVATKEINKKVVEKKTEDRRAQEMQRKLKTKTENEAESILEKINNMDAPAKDAKDNPTSSGSEVNEYYAKIQAIIYEHYIPPLNSQGNTVKVVIELSAIGKVLDFRILTYSSNKAFNEECDKIKDRLKDVLFPVNPNNKSDRITFTITSDKN